MNSVSSSVRLGVILLSFVNNWASLLLLLALLRMFHHQLIAMFPDVWRVSVSTQSKLCG